MNSSLTPQTPHRVLLIGLGRIGLQYDYDKPKEEFIFTHARAFTSHPAFSLVGAVDLSEKQRSLFEQQYKIPSFANLSIALQETQANIIVVATPTTEHVQTVRDIFANGTPHTLLCEKPLASTQEEAHEILELCTEHHCSLYVNYMRRSDRTTEVLRKRLTDQRIETPLRGHVWYSRGLSNSASHFINLLEDFFGEVLEVHGIRADGRADILDPEPDFRLVFSNADFLFQSVLAVSAFTNEPVFHNEMEWIAPNGRLRYEQGGARVLWSPAKASGAISGYTTISENEAEFFVNDFYRIQYHVAEELAQVLCGNQGKICTGAQALKTLHTIQKLKDLV